MVEEMGENCEVIIHVGDTNGGGTVARFAHWSNRPLESYFFLYLSFLCRTDSLHVSWKNVGTTN
jgi:hypothetical protein